MGYLDDIKALTVRVCSGSGVLVSPLSETCHYVLTAYHVIKEVIEHDIPKIVFEQHSPFYGEQVEVEDILKCEESDVAIIVIKRLKAQSAVVFPSEILPENEKRWHVGYPKNQNASDKAERCVEHEIRNWLGRYGKAFEEYQCEQIIEKKEIDGMSGGGIFDNSYHLLGIHKKDAAEDEKEQLSKFVMIPWACYEKELEKHQMPGVLQYDLSSFSVFKEKIFCFDDNQGAKLKLKSLLAGLATEKSNVEGISPAKAYEAFQESRNVMNYVKTHLLKEKDWIIFGEFLIAAKLLTDIDTETHLYDLFSKFQFVQADHDFDIFNVDEHIEPRELGVAADKDVVFVIGGIGSKGYQQDVRPKDMVRINQAPQKNEPQFNIARLGRDVFSEVTFVNGNLFKDAMLENTTQIDKAAGGNVDLYIQLLSSQIWPK